MSNPVIATRLGLSSKTVANYVSTILLRVGAADRAEVIRLIRDRRSG
ncbi:LuxR C-terminal-related transcriptional regulator [Pseudonocardia abyssalis]